MLARTLLGTTALVAGAAAFGHAQAAEPIMLSVTGYYSAGVSFTDEDFDPDISEDFQNVHVRQDGEIHFGGSTVLDNGLEVGVQVELEAFTTDDQIDEHYVWFEGTFGQIRIGADDHVAEQMHSFVPTATPGGTDTPTYFLFYDGTLLTPNTAGTSFTSDENKLIYFTPRFNGFQFGVSYAPNGSDAASGGEGGQYGTKVDGDGDYEESYSFAVNFVQAFNDVGVDIGASYQIETINGESDDDVFGGHLYLTFGAFTFGGSGKYVDFGPFDSGSEFYSYGGGVLYETGPWAFSLGATHTEFDVGFMGASFDYENTLVDLGGSYTLGPGVYLWAFVQYFEEELRLADVMDTPLELEHDGIAGMLGTTLEF